MGSWYVLCEVLGVRKAYHKRDDYGISECGPGKGTLKGGKKAISKSVQSTVMGDRLKCGSWS